MDSVFWHHIEKTLVELMQEESNNGQLEPRRLYLKTKKHRHSFPVNFKLVGMELVINENTRTAKNVFKYALFLNHRD